MGLMQSSSPFKFSCVFVTGYTIYTCKAICSSKFIIQLGIGHNFPLLFLRKVSRANQNPDQAIGCSEIFLE